MLIRYGVAPLYMAKPRLCNHRMCQVPLELDDGSFTHSHRPSSEGTLHVDTQTFLIARGMQA